MYEYMFQAAAHLAGSAVTPRLAAIDELRRLWPYIRACYASSTDGWKGGRAGVDGL